MSLKEKLGLSSFPMREDEILEKIKEAYRQNLTEVVFSAKGRNVKVKLNPLSPDGLMRGYEDYYKSKN